VAGCCLYLSKKVDVIPSSAGHRTIRSARLSRPISMFISSHQAKIGTHLLSGTSQAMKATETRTHVW
jgi:hypothetical protein